MLYIDEHFLPYYGARVISMGWFTVRDRPLKGSCNFIANDEEFNPLIFLIRSSSEDLIEKDCVKIFAYHMENKMCEILVNYYDKKKELWPALAMIIKRGAYIKLEQGKLTVKLRRFKNPEIDFAARRLCEDLNKMEPVTLDKFRLSIKYEVV